MPDKQVMYMQQPRNAGQRKNNRTIPGNQAKA